MRAREIEKIIRKHGGEHIRTVGSHKRYRVTANGVTVSTAVAQHPGDIPAGTLRKIDQDLAPALGKGWLIK